MRPNPCSARAGGLVPWIGDFCRVIARAPVASEAIASHLVQDLVGGLGPCGRLALVVVRLDVREDRRSQLPHARVRATAQGFLGEQAKGSVPRD